MQTALTTRRTLAALPIAFCVAALAVFCFSLLLHPRMPALGDFGDWVYESVLLRDLLAGHAHAGYILKHYPVPNSFNTVVMALLSFLTGWKLAAKLYLCLQLAIGFVCAAHLARTTRTHPALWFVLPGIFAGLNFWYGFTNFQVGVAWAMLECSLLLRNNTRAWKHTTLLCVCFFTHMIPTAFAALALLLWWWQERKVCHSDVSGRHGNRAAEEPAFRTYRWLATTLLPVVLLTAWYTAGRFLESHDADVRVHIQAPVKYGSGAFFAYKANSLLKSFGFVNPATNDDHSVALHFLGDKLFLLLFVLNAILVLAFVALIARRLANRKAHRGESFLWQSAAVFAVIYLVAPAIALGVSDPGSRALQVALWIAIFLAADGSALSRRLMPIAAICAIALLAANLTMFVRFASAPVAPAATTTRLPQSVAKFCHVFYEDKTQYYEAIERNDYTLDIFPTGMFYQP